jgi:hypothetical protein
MMTLESLLYPSLAIGVGIVLGLIFNKVESHWDNWRDRRWKEKND